LEAIFMSDDNKVILVVDDAVINIDLLSGLLRPLYKVKAAKSGAQALKILAKGGIDLVLLDIIMPGLDGYQTLAQIRGNPDIAHTPVIFVSGNDESGDGRAGEQGAQGFITKPVDASLALALIAQQLL
jgi:putative two-component system response regulator